MSKNEERLKHNNRQLSEPYTISVVIVSALNRNISLRCGTHNIVTNDSIYIPIPLYVCSGYRNVSKRSRIGQFNEFNSQNFMPQLYPTCTTHRKMARSVGIFILK